MAREVTDQSGSISVVPTHCSNYFYLLFLSRSTSVISAVTLSLSLVRSALVLTHALLSHSISVPQASLQPAYYLSLIAGSEISQQPREEPVQEPLLLFHLFSFIPPFCTFLFISLRADLEQLSGWTGSSALTVAVCEDF